MKTTDTTLDAMHHFSQVSGTMDAFLFAYAAHGALGQKRKVTGEDYIVHPYAVAKSLSLASIEAGTFWDTSLLSAAWLHDVIEDTKMSYDKIAILFGTVIADLVMQVTNPSALLTGADKERTNRSGRKAMDRLHLSEASENGKILKLADICDSCKDLKSLGDFGEKYRQEKLLVLPYLKGVTKLNEIMFKKAETILGAKNA